MRGMPVSVGSVDSPSQAALKALMTPAMELAQASLSRVIYQTITQSRANGGGSSCGPLAKAQDREGSGYAAEGWDLIGREGWDG